MKDHKKTTRILVAGGCHVTGYPVGPQYSFVSVLEAGLASLGFHVDLDLISHLGLNHPEKVVAQCTAARPDILILQLGSWETMQPGKLTSRAIPLKANAWTVKTMRHWFGLPADSRPGSNSQPAQRLPEHKDGRTGAGSTLGERILNFTLGHPFADLDRAEVSARSFFSVIQALQIPEVLVLSPLPTANAIVMYYRLRLAPIIEQCARSAGFHYCDVIHGPLRHAQPRRGRAPIFSDDLHLSAHGQRLLGEWLAPLVAGMRRREFEVSA